MRNQRNFSQFIGNLGRDPELRYTPSGTAVAKFAVAVNERQKVDGEYKKVTTWVDLIAYGGAAERAMKALKKGAQVVVDAKYQKRSWETPEGEKRVFHEFIVQGFDVLKWAADGEGSDEDGEDYEDEDGDGEFPF